MLAALDETDAAIALERRAALESAHLAEIAVFTAWIRLQTLRCWPPHPVVGERLMLFLAGLKRDPIGAELESRFWRLCRYADCAE